MDGCGIYGIIQTQDTLTGVIEGADKIQGKIDLIGGLVGEVGFPKCDYPLPYDGVYDVIPKAWVTQTLETADKYMEDDVRVHEVPYFETSNQHGTTCYIANEV